MQRLGIHIRKLRQLKNYTQSYMAERLKMSSSGYGKLERGDTDISMKRLEAVASILGVSIDEIIFFDEENYINNKTKNAKVGSSLRYENRQADTSHLNSAKDGHERLIAQLKEENRYLKELFQSLLHKKKGNPNHSGSGDDLS